MTSLVLEARELSGVMYRSSSKSASLEYPCTAVRACLIVRALYILGCVDLTYILYCIFVKASRGGVHGSGLKASMLLSVFLFLVLGKCLVVILSSGPVCVDTMCFLAFSCLL